MDPQLYLARRQLYPRAIRAEPRSDLGVIVVIPAFDEPDVVTTLHSLYACRRPDCAVEVLLVVNAPLGVDQAVRLRNRRAVAAARAFAGEYDDECMRVHAMVFESLPARHAGVGLARRIGMDEALARFNAINATATGVIACLDADCAVSPSYLTAIESCFRADAKLHAACVYFEHALSGDAPDDVYRAMAGYELHLRHYRHALTAAGFPRAYYTIGSCLAVRARDYALAGGMNRRKGGEDFYFVQKLATRGRLADITNACVYPGVRLSDRVPFGTGPALRARVRAAALTTYPSSAFEALTVLFQDARVCGRDIAGLRVMASTWPTALREFIELQAFWEKLDKIIDNTKSYKIYINHFFNYFNAFMVLKLMHHIRARGAPEQSLILAARDLLAARGMGRRADGPSATDQVTELLCQYRRLDRGRPEDD